MTLLSPPGSRGGSPPEDLDWKLRAFFQAQMPRPWPAAPVPIARRTAPIVEKPRTRWLLLRSRLALAACVALLMLGMLFLTVAPTGGPVSHDGALPVTSPTADSHNNPMNHSTPPTIKFPHESGTPDGPKIIDETLIQGPNGTTLKVTVEHP